MKVIPQAAKLASELVFIASRSSGPGGQNVNKVNSKVTLKFDVTHSLVLSLEERKVILEKLASRITKEGILFITSQDSRSQAQNKDAALAKFDELLIKAFAIPKVRKPSKPSKAAKRKRVDMKKRHSEKKQWRQKP